MAFASSKPADDDDDDLSNLDSLLSLKFNSLVPSISLQSSDDGNCSPTKSPSKPTQQEADATTESSCLSRRPHVPSTNLPLIAPNGAKKPPHTYPELIQCAIEKNGPLTVSQIYSWIMNTFPYFQSIGDSRWKPGIRHTLTTHSLFRKISKDSKYRGWQWSLVPEEERKKTKGSSSNSLPNSTHWKKQKMLQYEKVLGRRDYDPSIAYRQLHQQMQSQYNQQQQSPQQASPYPVHATPTLPRPDMRYAVVSTQDVFPSAAHATVSSPHHASMHHKMPLGNITNTHPSLDVLSPRHGLMHDTPMPSLGDTSRIMDYGSKMVSRLLETPLSVDPANFALGNPLTPETNHPNVGLLQIHRSNCEACITPHHLYGAHPHYYSPGSPPPGMYPSLWGMDRDILPHPGIENVPLEFPVHDIRY